MLQNSSNCVKLNATNPPQLTLQIERYGYTLKVGIKLCILSPKEKKIHIWKKKKETFLCNLKDYMNPSIPG